jgi:Collagen triple helix repeat (20 copies)
MLSAIRTHLTYANVAATLALVFASTGGAVAASSSGGRGGAPAKLGVSATASANGSRVSDRQALAFTAKSKPKTGPRGRRGPAGPAGKTGAPGATGPAGPVGPAGAKGETGATGVGGEGKAGESVKIARASGSECNGEGGASFSNASGKVAACNGEEGTPGKEGSPWTAGGVLPSGSTETGAWTSGRFEHETETENYSTTAISFPIPLKAALGAEHVHYVSLKKVENHEVPAECDGIVNGVETESSAADPLAKEGNLCVYQGIVVEPEGTETFTVPTIEALSGAAEPGASTAGAALHVYYEGPQGLAEMQGSWAVTAP